MKKTLYASVRILSLALILAGVATASNAAYLEIQGGGGEYLIKNKKTLLDNRYYHVFRQRYDFSCGSAALATLLTYSYDRPVDERVIIQAMYSVGNKEKIRREGFSLLDMKNYLQSVGLKANGYRASLDKLSKVGVPAIVLINRKGYMHFVVVQGVTKDKVLLGDPAQGKKIVDRKAFEDMWKSRILFVVEDDMPKARHTFNTVGAWHVRKPGDFVMPMPNNDLSQVTLVTGFAPNIVK